MRLPATPVTPRVAGVIPVETATPGDHGPVRLHSQAMIGARGDRDRVSEPARHRARDATAATPGEHGRRCRLRRCGRKSIRSLQPARRTGGATSISPTTRPPGLPDCPPSYRGVTRRGKTNANPHSRNALGEALDEAPASGPAGSIRWPPSTRTSSTFGSSDASLAATRRKGSGDPAALTRSVSCSIAESAASSSRRSGPRPPRGSQDRWP